MTNDLFEKVEYLRSNSNIGYEEAAQLLERCNGDMTQAMIELERAHRLNNQVNQNENAWDDAFARGKERVQQGVKDSENWFKKLAKTKIQVSRDGEKVTDVPVFVPIAAAVLAPQIAIAGAVIGGLSGFRIHETKKNDGQDNANPPESNNNTQQ